MPKFLDFRACQPGRSGRVSSETGDTCTSAVASIDVVAAVVAVETSCCALVVTGAGAGAGAGAGCMCSAATLGASVSFLGGATTVSADIDTAAAAAAAADADVLLSSVGDFTSEAATVSSVSR